MYTYAAMTMSYHYASPFFEWMPRKKKEKDEEEGKKEEEFFFIATYYVDTVGRICFMSLILNSYRFDQVRYLFGDQFEHLEVLGGKNRGKKSQSAFLAFKFPFFHPLKSTALSSTI